MKHPDYIGLEVDENGKIADQWEDEEIEEKYLPIKPILLKLDVTEYWYDEELVGRCGRIYDVYIYDANIVWHLCSFQKSIEIWYLYTTTDNQISDEDDMILMEGNRYTPYVDYMNDPDLDTIEHKILPEEEYDETLNYEDYDDWYKNWWEGLVENYRDNWEF